MHIHVATAKHSIHTHVEAPICTSASRDSISFMTFLGSRAYHYLNVLLLRYGGGGGHASARVVVSFSSANTQIMVK